MELMRSFRSGKSSISGVVFDQLPPNETLFLEVTARIKKYSISLVLVFYSYQHASLTRYGSSFMDFQVWDFPGLVDILEDPRFDVEAVFGGAGALVWVIDATDLDPDDIVHLNAAILSLQRAYPHINVEVFIHKVDDFSDDDKLDILRHITICIREELLAHGFEDAPVTFHLTSIYNHSIFEAFSKAIQKLIPRLDTLESMLTNLCRTCRFENAFVVDVRFKICIANDSTTVDMASYEICSDYLNVITDISELYGTWQRSEDGRRRLEGEPWSAPLDDQVGCPTTECCLVIQDGNKPIMVRHVNSHLVLIAIMKEDSYNSMPLVNINVEVVVNSLAKFFNIIKPQ